MRPSAATHRSGSVLVVMLLLLVGSLTRAAAEVGFGRDLHRSAHTHTAPPVQPSYQVRNLTWSNCDASLPVQLDELTFTIVQDNVFFLLVRFHTAADIPSAVVQQNDTVTLADGSSEPHLIVYGLESILLPPASLPIAAGTTDVLLSATGISRRVVGHWVQRVHFLDASLTAIACVHDEFDYVQV